MVILAELEPVMTLRVTFIAFVVEEMAGSAFELNMESSEERTNKWTRLKVCRDSYNNC